MMCTMFIFLPDNTKKKWNVKREVTPPPSLSSRSASYLVSLFQECPRLHDTAATRHVRIHLT